MEYSFIFNPIWGINRKEPEPIRLSGLINYITKRYKLKYKETRDFEDLSVSYIINLKFSAKKQIVFETKKELKNLCPTCNFPVNDEDLVLSKPIQKLCMCCETVIKEKDRNVWRKNR